MNKEIELWADSFHEGNWCCSNLANIANKNGFTIEKKYLRGFIPKFIFKKNNDSISFTVYGSYRSWSPIPKKIADLIDWGKPDFLAYDKSEDKIIFAVEETAAIPTGNQALQRCERQYGSSRAKVPYWYLISEFGIHKDGGVRRDSIWPSIAGIKLSIHNKTPSIVLHYSDSENPEDYQSGNGVNSLFNTLFLFVTNHLYEKNIYDGTLDYLESQYREMIQFINSQWESIIDFLPGIGLLDKKETPIILSQVATGNMQRKDEIKDLLRWPIIKDVPNYVKTKWTAKELIKFDPLCYEFEQDIAKGNAYYLSDNAGSGRPPSTSDLKGYIEGQRKLFEKAPKVNPPVKFNMKIDDFPLTDSGRRHVTTAKNIVYLYDSWNQLITSIIKAYPRLKEHLKPVKDDSPVFVYVSNSVKKGRLFGDPFTGQISAYSTVFGKFDNPRRRILVYFPHQCFSQCFSKGKIEKNKGTTLYTELTDLIIFNEGIAVNLETQEIM